MSVEVYEQVEPGIPSCVRIQINYKRLMQTSLVTQWLGIRLPMHWGIPVRALVREDPTCLGETMPESHNY